MSAQSLDALIDSRKLLIVCGTGGVGKTTLSASIAVRGALQGKKTAVITIDPARRLANALGMTKLGHEPTELREKLAEVLKTAPPRSIGSFCAISPETRKTFDEFLESLTSNPALLDSIRSNPIFKLFSGEFSGTHEMMAMQKLHALQKEAHYDLLVLDTPPSQSMETFLQAPHLLTRFFETKILGWLALSGSSALQTSLRIGTELLEKLTGASFVREMVQLAQSMLELQTQFALNLRGIEALLTSKELGFLIVTSPQEQAAQTAESFRQFLAQRHFQYDGWILNRSLEHLTPDPVPPQIHEILSQAQRFEAELKSHLNHHPWIASVPELARDVHSIEDLIYVSQFLGPQNSPQPPPQERSHF